VMCDVAKSDFSAHWVAFEPDTALNEQGDELVRQKFAQPGYTRKR
jgi:hypothetical protein